jgi:hypothetical protein
MIGKKGFSNSVIDAQTLGRVSLGAVSSSNGGTPFGLASSDIVLLVATIMASGSLYPTRPPPEAVTAALAKVNVRLVDLVIRII